MIAEHLTRYIIAIEPDIISFQRECAGVPIGRARIFPRSAVTDLGVYPRTYHGRSRPLPRLGRLSVWVNGKSIEIESFFPIREGLALARDLREAGIVLSWSWKSEAGGGLLLTHNGLSYAPSFVTETVIILVHARHRIS
jgi:hypothetical protein